MLLIKKHILTVHHDLSYTFLLKTLSTNTELIRLGQPTGFNLQTQRSGLTASHPSTHGTLVNIRITRPLSSLVHPTLLAPISCSSLGAGHPLHRALPQAPTLLDLRSPICLLPSLSLSRSLLSSRRSLARTDRVGRTHSSSVVVAPFPSGPLAPYS